MNLKIRGVIVPLFTLYDEDGNIDKKQTQLLVNKLIDSGVQGLFICGTTGEFPLLSIEERLFLTEFVLKINQNRIPIIVHTGSANLKDAIFLTKHAYSNGAQAAALITPYYFIYNDDALFNFYQFVANQVPEFPIYLYNNPLFSNNEISFNLLTRLTDHCSNIVGIKDSSGNLDLASKCVSIYKEKFNTAIGTEKLFLSALLSGIDACVSGIANIYPETFVKLFKLYEEGNLKEASKYQLLINQTLAILDNGKDISLLKGILSEREIGSSKVRPPLLNINNNKVQVCWKKLNELLPLN